MPRLKCSFISRAGQPIPPREWCREGKDRLGEKVRQPDPEKLAHWKELGVTEVLYGFPDKPEEEIPGYIAHLAGKLAALGL